MSDRRRDAVQPGIDFGSAAEPPQTQAPDPAGSGGRRLDPPTRRALLVLGVIAAIGIVQIGFLLFVEADRALRHRTAIAHLEQEIGALQREADGLEAVAARADDEAFREQLARRQGFLYPDETRVIVLDPAPAR